MLDSIFGLPAHPLIVHATVVIVPAAAISVLVATVWRRFRTWSGWMPMALSVVGLILAPLSTSSGEELEHRVGASPLVHEHAELGEMLVWWMLGLTALATAAWWLQRREDRAGPPWLRPLVRGGCVAVAIGTLVVVALIGHSGAKAAWDDVDAGATPTATAHLPSH